MSRAAVARNYAETLLELASREDAVELFGERLGEIASLYRDDESFRRFLATPRVALEDKKRVVREALGEEDTPELFTRFLLVVLEKRRQGHLPGIAAAYRDAVDEREGRVHAAITLAEEPDEELRREIAEGVAAALETEVVPHFHTDERIVGGMVVRVGDRVLDGSLRRRLSDLETRLLATDDGTRRALLQNER